MTSENTLTGPDDPGIDWDLLDQQVFGDEDVQDTPVDAPAAPVVAAPAPVAVPAPVPAPEPDDEDEEMDLDADAFLWPTVLDKKGRPTPETARPNPDAMRSALRRAKTTSAADVDVLAEAISEFEARQIIHQAADQRGFERELDGKVAKHRAELASEGAHRQAEHDHRMSESRRRRENRAAAALERRDRALDPTSRIVRLAAAERFVPWIAVLPAVLAAGLGAVNVGVSLDVLSPGTQLINWLVEPLLTLPIVAILIAQILGAVGEGDANPYRRLEWSLVGVALALNVGLHIAVDGLAPAAFVWAIVPAGLAISANLVPRLIRNTREALIAASVEPNRGPQNGPQIDAGVAFRSAPVAPVRSKSTRIAPEPPQVNVGDAPESRSDAEVFAELAEAVRDRRTDPGTGRPIDPSSAESIRRTIGVGKSRARALRDAFAATE